MKYLTDKRVVIRRELGDFSKALFIGVARDDCFVTGSVIEVRGETAVRAGAVFRVARKAAVAADAEQCPRGGEGVFGQLVVRIGTHSDSSSAPDSRTELRLPRCWIGNPHHSSNFASTPMRNAGRMTDHHTG